jgi:hypothetical protein
MHMLYTLIAVIALATPATILAAPHSVSTTTPSRIRPDDARSATLFLEGQRRSAILRALAHAIEARDVIVYLQMEPLLVKGSVGGMVTWLTATKHARYVRISMNPELPMLIAIAVLGHELQHVLEIANEPSVISAGSLETFYRRIGINTRTQSSHWDTEAARQVGEEVRKDLSGARAIRIAESVERFDPAEWHIVYLRAREEER